MGSLTAVDVRLKGRSVKNVLKAHSPAVFKLDKMQRAKFKENCNERLRIFLGPTGCGKSLCAQAYVLWDRHLDMKCILTVPNTDIRSGVEDLVRIQVPGLGTEVWPAFHICRQSEGDVTKIVQFIQAPLAVDMPGRILICTHQALVMAYKRLHVDPYPGKPLDAACRRNGLQIAPEDVWAKISLTVDEAHHIQTGNAEVDDRSALGKVVSLLLKQPSCRVTLMTATFMRNKGEILSPGVLKTFCRAVYHLDEYWKYKRPVKHIRWRFLFDDQLRALESEFQKYPGRKTLVYLPQTREGEQQVKLDLLESGLALARRYGLRAVDLVAENVRDRVDGRPRGEVRRELLDDIKSGNSPDVVFTQKMWMEGANWPGLTRVILLEPRGSYLENIQIHGRLLRAYPGKTEVDFVVVVPTTNGVVDPSLFQSYYNIVYTCMVSDWQFEQLDLLPPEVKAARRRLDEYENQERLGRVFGNSVLETEGGDAQVVEQAYSDVVDAILGDDFSPEVREIAKKSKRDNIEANFKRMLLDASQIPYTFPELTPEEQKSTVLGVGRVLAVQMGCSTLRAARETFQKCGKPFLEKELEFWLRMEREAGHVLPPNLHDVISRDVDQRTWAAAETWLKGRGLSLRMLCTSLGLLGAGFELSCARRWIKSYIADHRRVPGPRSGVIGYDGERRGWDALEIWLHKQQTSLLRLSRQVKNVDKHVDISHTSV